ncbi:MAG: hypothetical protein J5676_12985 [Bacteroidaceae bacterium]|nr:hypothetical protein [Bacteroidaceae bacterium]
MNETVKQILDMLGADEKLKKNFFDILNGNSTDKVGALVNLFKEVGKNVSADDVKKVMEAAKSLPINSDMLKKAEGLIDGLKNSPLGGFFK